MGRTTEPLADGEEERLLHFLRSNVHQPGQFGFEVRLTFLFLLTGIHPAALAYPRDYELSIYGKELRWKRPKTMRAMRFPIPDEFAGWLPEFLASLPMVSTVRFNQWVKRTCERAGLRGVTPRTLRHAAFARVVERHGVMAAMDLLGASERVAVDYARRATTRAAREKVRLDPF